MQSAALGLSISIPTALVLFHKMRLKNTECSPGTDYIHPNCSGLIPKNAAQNAAQNAECSPGPVDISSNCSSLNPKNAAQNAAEKCGVQPWNC